MSRGMLACFVLLSLTGCASVPLAPPALDIAAKQFQAPPAGQAQLYVIRDSVLGSSVLFQVLLDGQLVGSLGSRTYLLIPLSSGTHLLSALTTENHANLSLAVTANHTYYARLFPKLGWTTTRVGLEHLEGAEGREAVRATTRVAVFEP